MIMSSASSDGTAFDINDYWGPLPSAVSGDKGGEDENDVDDGRIPAAEHVMVMLDCSPDMFAPCLPEQDHEEDNFYDDNGGRKNKKKQQRKHKLVSPVDAVVKSLEEYVRLTVRNTLTTKTGKRNCFGFMVFGTKARAKKSPQDGDKQQQEKNDNKSKETDNLHKEDEVEADHHDDSEDEEDDNDEYGRRPKKHLTTAHVIIPLEPPGASTVKTLRSFLEDKHHDNRRQVDLQQEYGHENQAAYELSRMDHNNYIPLKLGLDVCSSAFNYAKQVRKKITKADAQQKLKDDEKQIWIFTNHDDPLPKRDNDDDQFRENHRTIFMNFTRDLLEAGLTIKVFPLPAPHKKKSPFRKDAFFNEFAQIPEGFHCTSSYLNLEDWMARQWKRIRRTLAVPLFLPDEIQSSKDNNEDKKEEGADGEEPHPNIMLDFFRPIQFHVEPQKIKIGRQVGV
jgi:hypothetical protein